MLIVDWTHMSRRASGIERVTTELFSAEALSPLPARIIGGASRAGRLGIALRQQVLLPATAASRPGGVFLFPGYPPAPAFSLMPDRTVLYVHDLFLVSRSRDLNRAGRYYLAPQFKLALRRLRYFLANSETSARELARHTGPDAEIRTYRPTVRNVFGLKPRPPEADRADASRPLVVGTIGTIEPRKNMPAAADICAALSTRLGRPVELHVLGRRGWGGDADLLARRPFVRLLGFLPDDEARAAIARFDIYLSSSHDEGLGLPLLEAQYGGIAVVAPEKPVFREVLDTSGTYVDVARPDAAAEVIAAMIASPDWQHRATAAAIANVARWNTAAERDRTDVLDFLAARLRAVSQRSGVMTRWLQGAR